MNFKLEVFKPFGPVIAKTFIPKEIIHKLNSYFDSKKEVKKLNHGSELVGNVKKEIKLEYDFIKKSGWLEFLGSASQKYIEIAAEKKISNFNLIDSWIVSQFKNEYNPTHWHNGHLSGVGYLKVPGTLGKTIQKEKKINRNGNLQLIHGNQQFLSNSLLNIIPKLGEFYLFPNYLLHTVFPFCDTDEERRSVSFNATIDNAIYNI